MGGLVVALVSLWGTATLLLIGFGVKLMVGRLDELAGQVNRHGRRIEVFGRQYLKMSLRLGVLEEDVYGPRVAVKADLPIARRHPWEDVLDDDEGA